jgi:hypothetical protein
MTEERRPLAELLAKAGDGDFPRSAAEAQLLMETEGLICAGPHERTGDRTTYSSRIATRIETCGSCSCFLQRAGRLPKEDNISGRGELRPLDARLCDALPIVFSTSLSGHHVITNLIISHLARTAHDVFDPVLPLNRSPNPREAST